MEWHWQSVDDTELLHVVPDDGHKKLAAQYDLCVTGEVRIKFCIFIQIIFVCRINIGNKNNILFQYFRV